MSGGQALIAAICVGGLVLIAAGSVWALWTTRDQVHTDRAARARLLRELERWPS